MPQSFALHLIDRSLIGTLICPLLSRSNATVLLLCLWPIHHFIVFLPLTSNNFFQHAFDLICQIYRIEKLTQLPRVIVEGSESLQVSNTASKVLTEEL